MNYHTVNRENKSKKKDEYKRCPNGSDHHTENKGLMGRITRMKNVKRIKGITLGIIEGGERLDGEDFIKACRVHDLTRTATKC